MAEQFYTILTNIGKASIANATSLGTKVEFKYFALGDGNGSYYNPTETQTSLKNEVWRGQIAQITVDEKNPNWIVLETIIPASMGGFMIREAGVFDVDGSLLAVGKYPETYKPVVADGSAKDLYIRMILEVSNTSVVTLKIDPTVILATKKDIDVLSNRITKNTNDIEELKQGSTIITDLETENKTLAGAINELNNKKVNKVTGKGLSTNDYTNEEKQKNQDNADNISSLQQELETHKAEKATQNEFGHIQVGNGLSVTSGVVSHPTTAGNKHIPSGGAINQILEYSASGTAKWGRKITFGTADPAGGEDGDIYFQYE